MSKLRLTFACGLYDRMLALYTDRGLRGRAADTGAAHYLSEFTSVRRRGRTRMGAPFAGSAEAE